MKSPTHMTIRSSDGRSYRRPIPWRVQREFELCAAMDVLVDALAKSSADVVSVTNAFAGDDADVAPRAVPPEVLTLLAAINRLDSAGEAIVMAIKTLLNV